MTMPYDTRQKPELETLLKVLATRWRLSANPGVSKALLSDPDVSRAVPVSEETK